MSVNNVGKLKQKNVKQNKINYKIYLLNNYNKNFFQIFSYYSNSD